MAVKRTWSLFLVIFSVAATSGSLKPLKLDSQQIVLNLHPPSVTIKLQVANDSSSLNRPWNDGKEHQEKIPAPDSTISPTTPSSSYSDCGMANWMNGDNNRIVGGVQAYPNEFPWQAFVKVETYNGKIFYCGGSLVDDRWILTTAQCISISG
jgi:hypothetical protein